MSLSTRKRRKGEPYFARRTEDPAPLTFRIKRRTLFSDADPMGILWHGRYPAFFESAAAELHRACGLGYLDFQQANVYAPIVQLHIDYIASVLLDEEVMVEATLVWNDAARIDTEYAIVKPDGRIAARGFTVQLFTASATGIPLLAPPCFVEASRQAWRDGEFAYLQ